MKTGSERRFLSYSQVVWGQEVDSSFPFLISFLMLSTSKRPQMKRVPGIGIGDHLIPTFLYLFFILGDEIQWSPNRFQTLAEDKSYEEGKPWVFGYLLFGIAWWLKAARRYWSPAGSFLIKKSAGDQSVLTYKENINPSKCRYHIII